jgi:lysophospholipase L1-like esterase
VNSKSDTLLITAGDSWTWGDSLGNAKARLQRDDPEYRLNHVYGSLLSRWMSCDWINLALPGISNQLIINWTEELLNKVSEYRTIVCVITLTESGRHEEIQYLQHGLGSLQQNLKSMLTNTYQQIEQLKNKYPKVKFLVAHNFTDPGENFLGLDKSWLEVMMGKELHNQTHIVVSEHIQQLNYDRVFADTPEVIDRALARISLMDQCQHCGKQDTRHPNEVGHELWAEYLMSKL